MTQTTDFINKEFTYVVAGASNNTEKYGYKVFMDLHRHGFKVIPLNPNQEEIEGVKVAHSLDDVDEQIDVLITVTPSQVTKQLIEKAHLIGIKKMWMQPGSFDESCVSDTMNKGIEVIAGACIMMEK